MNILKKLFERGDVGIDLGAANMRVWVRGKGLVMDEPSVVALPRLCHFGSEPRILAVGAEAAKRMGESDNVRKSGMVFMPQQECSPLALVRLGVIESGAPLARLPGVFLDEYPESGDSWYYLRNDCYAVWPRKVHVIADVEIISKMLRYCLAKAKDAVEGTFRKPRVVIAVPVDITEVERRALEDAAHSAGAGKVLFFDNRMAVALGVGCNTCEPKGCMFVDIGASMTTIALVSSYGNIRARTLRVGGDEMDNAIVKHMRHRHKLLVGEREAEDMKIKIGTARKLDEERDCEIKGSDLVEGDHRTVNINLREVREEVLDRVLVRIEDALSDFLKFDVPECLAANLARNGIVLTGGGVLLRGLDKRLADATGLPVRVADDPAHAAIKGVGVVLDELDFLSKKARRH